MATDIHVSGLRELNEFLDKLPAKVEKNLMRGALRAGAQVIKDAAVANCPVGEPSSEGKRLYKLRAGSLRDSIRVGTRVVDRGFFSRTVMATIKAGGKTKAAGDVFYAHIIEFTGAISHAITGRDGHPLYFGGRYISGVFHPGMSPRPFMRPALDSRAQAAIIAAAEYMKRRIATKHGLDTSHIIIEGDE